MPNYIVTLEAAWIVKRVKTPSDAMNIAVAEAGKKLNPDLDFVRIDVGETTCPKCGTSLKSVFLVANTALVGLKMEMKVFNAQGKDHAAKIAKYEIGKRMQHIPLEVLDVEEIE
ncbi:hypothetical protein DRP04_14295 [Archaeoglobales archaeon]|nr:MAG: hypothetical protein B6U96_12160 [Archaeoglobales archaeon ex4484_92]RLI74757.1 MAG: hypothetical protein DRP04_14295 [Archaeoglobales archaeon]HDI51128.1 DUF555 domain-containing protein [Bacteroidota bacterium]